MCASHLIITATVCSKYSGGLVSGPSERAAVGEVRAFNE